MKSLWALDWSIPFTLLLGVDDCCGLGKFAQSKIWHLIGIMYVEQETLELYVR